jgi:site-specific DNA-methyltransferase (adenine-specific)
VRHFHIYRADAIEWLSKQRANSIHAVVTDPPFGLLEYSAKQIQNRAQGNGIWRLPNSRDGAKRQPTPRYTVLTVPDRSKLRGFVLQTSAELFRVLVPGAHIFWATHPLFSHIVCEAFTEVGFEKRGEVIRTVGTLRGGDRPKGAHDEFHDVCVLPKGCWEPWVLFRKPLRGRIQDNLRRFGTGGLRMNSRPFRDLIASRPATRIEREIAPHPSLKPQQFLREVVWAALPLGRGVILDPFMGSGSTIAAAQALGLESIGVERSPRYFQMARRAIPALAALKIEGEGSKSV